MFHRFAGVSAGLMAVALLAGCGGAGNKQNTSIFDLSGVSASGSVNMTEVSGIALLKSNVMPGSGYVLSRIETLSGQTFYNHGFTFLSSVFDVVAENGTTFPAQLQVKFALNSPGADIAAGQTYTLGSAVVQSVRFIEMMSPTEKSWVASEGTVHVDAITGTELHGRTYTLTLKNIKMRSEVQDFKPFGTGTFMLNGTVTVKDIE